MSAVVIDIQNADDMRDVVHRGVQALAEGQLVAFPTETVYGLAASALDEQAVNKLAELKSRGQNSPLTLAIKSADDACDYAPNMSNLGCRLARRCWPGPVTLVLDDSHPDTLLRQLPGSVQQLVSPGETIGLRVPAHHLILDVLQMLAGPIVLTSANRGGQPDAVTAAEVSDSFGDEIAIVMDDGRSQFGQPSSVVRVTGGKLELLREGVVTKNTLSRLANFMVILVCTGNTCRSPMAEVLCRQRLAERLNCQPQELEDHGATVLSAGIAAMRGSPASSEAVNVMAERKLDLSDHMSQPLTDRLARYADLLLTMTEAHRAGILAHWPEVANRAKVLCPDAIDVSDPIGGSREVYIRCADQIDAALRERIGELDLE